MIPPTPWVRSFCPLSLLYPSVSDFQFRYTPVTVGKGRAAWFSLRSASVLSFGRGDKAAESGDVDYEYLFQMLAPSKSFRYLATASEISLILINSSAEWEREDSPGPSLNEGKCIRAWSLRVGLPNGFMPMATHFLIRGCSGSMRDDFRRKL